MIHLHARFEVQDGKADEFRAIATEATALVRQNEEGTNLKYDWYVDGNTFVVLETYVDSAALMKHMGNVGALIGKMGEISSLTGELYGEPSDELRAAFANLPIRVHTPM